MPAQSIAPVRPGKNSRPRHLPLNSAPTWASSVGICPSALNWRTCMPRFISGLTALSVVSLTALAPVGLMPATAANPDYFTSHSAPGAEVELSVLGSHRADIFDAGAAEIVAHYAAKQQTLVVNAEAGTVQVLDSSDPEKPTAVTELKTAGMSSADGASVPAGAVANSVAVRADGLAAVALEAPTKTDDGWVGFFDLSGDEPKPLGAVRAGALPDSVVFDDEGTHAVIANEGEPAEDYSVDPEGTVSVVALPEAVQAPGQEDVKTADFRAFEGDALPEGVRVFGGREDAGTGTPKHPVSENLEPEYSTVIGGKAYVTLQEANAIAVVDLASATTEKLMPLGTQDVSEVPFDVSNKDDKINRANWPVQSFLQPDTIRSIEIGGRDYLLTANEGDTRDWDGYSEEIRVKDLGSEKKGLAPICESVVEGVTNPDGSPMTIEDLQKEENLGRLTITKADGLNEDGSCYETIYGVGGRSFSIFDTDGKQVFDSADDFERITAEVLPKNFNSNNSESNFDNRSDDKGPEPEAIEVGQIGEKTYAFIGMERIGGIFVYDITDPAKSEYVTYLNNRNFAVQPEDNVAEAGDSGPESIVFVPSAALKSDGAATAGEAGNAGMLIVGNEVTGSTTFYAVDSSLVGDDPTEEPTADPTDDPTGEPTDDPTGEPTDTPTTDPTGEPTTEPTGEPTQQPTDSPSAEPSPKPSDEPGDDDKGRLPRTGAQIGALAGLGALLAAAGGAAVWMARRRSS
ncbi:PT domain-containing protein [Brevibacterium luteolum]|uniref:PT domain-containing protein n=2 Tax=Brevibacterium luteolum TaxID=199591 RepID=A0A849AUH7_9MICO|nr:PT domain-containing protein [Brevibacterium luteolum]